MYVFRTFLVFLLFLYSRSTYAVQATATQSIFYVRNTADSGKWDANIAFSWQAQNRSLHFTKDEKGNWQTELVCIIRCSQNETVVKEQTFFISTPPKKTLEEAQNNSIADQYSFILDTGAYTLELLLFEKNHKEDIYQYTDTFSIKAHRNSRAFLSGIQLLDTSFQSNAQTIYTRNGCFDYPLSSNYLSEKLKTVTTYQEIYNTNHTPASDTPLYITTYISPKPYTMPVKGYERIDTIRQVSEKIIVKYNFPLDALKSGNYYVNSILNNKKLQVIDQHLLFIQRYNDNPQTEPLPVEKETGAPEEQTADSSTFTHVLDLTNTFVSKYSPAQVRAILKMLSLIADKTERISIDGFLDRPDELYSKYFIYNFWEKRDKKEPEKAWLAYTEQIKEVNKLFGNAGKPGYETDRGRVYIQYGKPNDRIIVNNESNAFPYEIWQYYQLEKIGKEAVFLFYRPGQSLGGYILLHCNVPGEKRNTGWRSLLYNNSISGNTNTFDSDSKAEQFIGNK